MDSIRVAIADDHQIFIEGLKTVLTSNDDYSFEFVLDANSGKDLLHKLRSVEADILLLDLNMPDEDGLDCIPKLKKRFKDLKIIALTMFDNPKIIKSAFKAGVHGYVLKGKPTADLFKAIDTVLKDETYLGEGVVLNFLPNEKGIGIKTKSAPFSDKFMQKYRLTARELEVLQLITHALSNKEIAKALYISDQTVSVHRKNIMRKLGVSNTAALLKVAYENELV